MTKIILIPKLTGDGVLLLTEPLTQKPFEMPDILAALQAGSAVEIMPFKEKP